MSKNNSMSVYRLMSHIINALRRENSKFLSDYDLTLGQFAVMEALYSSGELTTGEVMEKILTTGGNIPVIVRNLEKEGFITRTRSKSDRRKILLNLTEKGRDLMRVTTPANIDYMDALISIWDEDDKRQLIELMEKFERDAGDRLS